MAAEQWIQRNFCGFKQLFVCALGLAAVLSVVVILSMPSSRRDTFVGSPIILTDSTRINVIDGPLAGRHITETSCLCSSKSSPVKRLESTCSEKADQRGPNQKVVSFVYFAPEDLLNKAEGQQNTSALRKQLLPRYFDGIPVNAEKIPEIYGHDWTMRLYMNIPREKYPRLNQMMCQYECQYPHLDLCRMDELEDWNFARERSFAIWRFLPMADSLVDIVLSRDLDSRPTLREKAAVDDWLSNSNASLHIMRDYPHHDVAILAGMWGVDLHRLD